MRNWLREAIVAIRHSLATEQLGRRKMASILLASALLLVPAREIFAGNFVNDSPDHFGVSHLASANPTDMHGAGSMLRQAAPSLSIGDATVTEGDTGTAISVVFTITLSPGSSDEVEVDFVTGDGTASAGEDYVGAAGTATFDPGVLTQSITVIVSGDDIVEDDETFFVNLINPVNATLDDQQAAGTILDDDTAGYAVAPPTLALMEGASGHYTINLSSQPEAAVTLNLSVDRPDQCSVTPTVVLDATNWNTAVDNVSVTSHSDNVDEMPHPDCVISHVVTTADPTYAALPALENYTVGITDDDVADVLVNPTKLDLLDGTASATYTVRLATTPSAGAVTVEATFDGSLLTVNGGVLPVMLVFTDSTPQVLTVAGLPDAFTGSDDTTLITHAITDSDAGEYPVDMLVDSVVVGRGVLDPLAGYPPQPPAPRCIDENFFPRSPVRASMPDSYSHSVFCRLLVVNGRYLDWFGAPLTHAGNIGSPGVVALDILQAVDVFSPAGLTQFTDGAVVCLRGTGRMLLLSASQAPRIPRDIDTFRVEEFVGFSCVVLHEPGTLVLANPGDTTRLPAVTAPPQAVTGIGAPLADCMVTTRFRMQLRAGPGTDTSFIRLIPYNATLTSFERHGNWFLVDFHGTRGWLSGDYLTPRGECDG